jgi:hypothetical protein
LTDLIADPQKRAEMSQAAFEDVRARYDITHVSKAWADFFTDFAGKLPREAIRFDRPIPWRRRALQRLDRIKLNLAIVYHEGGVPLVIRRIARKLLRLAIGT